MEEEFGGEIFEDEAMAFEFSDDNREIPSGDWD